MHYFSLAFWNGLTRAHLGDVMMILTATILVLLDDPVRDIVNRLYRPKSRAMRFVVFVLVCSFGYAAVAVVTARVLKWVLLIKGGTLLFPIAFAVLIAVGIFAARQKHI